MSIEYEVNDEPEPDARTEQEMMEWSEAESNAPPNMLAAQRTFDRRARQ